MRWLVLILFGLLLAGFSVQPDLRAQTSLSGEASAERWGLFETLRTAPTEAAGQAAAAQIWQFWLRQSPDETSAAMIEQAMERRRQYDFAGAMEHLDQLVVQAPDWPEAWNQRATVLYLQGNFDHSLDDVEKVLALEPMHFGALAGKAIILMQQGRIALGQIALRAALAVHPWLSERAMLLPEAPSQEL
jgi:Tfp pilus assembly protein PilF